MREAIGQRLEAEARSRTPTSADFTVAANEAWRRARAAKRELEDARSELGLVAKRVLLGLATENELVEIEAEIASFERDSIRWTAAARELDEDRGVIRDSAGNVL